MADVNKIIREIRLKKQRLEIDIKTLLDKFTEESSLTIEKIEIDLIDRSTIDKGPHSEFVYGQVQVILKPI